MPINEDAINFLKYAFAETKDLGLHFLTVLTAVLVFSLAFAEKFTNFTRGGRLTRITLGSSWSCFLLAIVTCGIAICYVALSGGAASANGAPDQCWAPMRSAMNWLLISGGLFVLGLVSLLISTLMSTFRK